MAKKKSKKGPKKSTQTIIHVIISFVFIVWGILSPLTAIDALIFLNISALISAAVGVIMLLAGILGLLRIRPEQRRIFGIIIFVMSIISVVFSLKSGLAWRPILQAVMAWLYIIW